MSITVNGQSCVPPGFRFHPTEEELLGYYLRKKVAGEKIDLDVIRDVDLNKLEPWDIQDKCRIGSTPQNDWYFFSHKDKKYPTGTRTNRATAAGFWKATGRDKVIYTSVRRIGMRKTLVFYKGRAPHGQKSDWIMHEYRLDEQHSTATASLMEEGTPQEEGWVICRVFKKKNHHKSFDLIPGHRSSAPSDGVGDGALSQILHYMGISSCKEESDALLLSDAGGGGLHQKFMKLPQLHSPASAASGLLPPWLPNELPPQEHLIGNDAAFPAPLPSAELSVVNGWAALDRLLASTELDAAEASSSKEPLSCFDDVYSPARFYAAAAGDYHQYNGGAGGGDGDLWSLARSASNHIGHVSL